MNSGVVRLDQIMSILLIMNKHRLHLLLRCFGHAEHNLIHGFTISVPVLILPVSRQLLLRNGKISSKCLF